MKKLSFTSSLEELSILQRSDVHNLEIIKVTFPGFDTSKGDQKDLYSVKKAGKIIGLDVEKQKYKIWELPPKITHDTFLVVETFDVAWVYYIPTMELMIRYPGNYDVLGIKELGGGNYAIAFDDVVIQFRR